MTVSIHRSIVRTVLAHKFAHVSMTFMIAQSDIDIEAWFAVVGI